VTPRHFRGAVSDFQSTPAREGRQVKHIKVAHFMRFQSTKVVNFAEKRGAYQEPMHQTDNNPNKE
jgi:hypothetical protein